MSVDVILHNMHSVFASLKISSLMPFWTQKYINIHRMFYLILAFHDFIIVFFLCLFLYRQRSIRFLFSHHSHRKISLFLLNHKSFLRRNGQHPCYKLFFILGGLYSPHILLNKWLYLQHFITKVHKSIRKKNVVCVSLSVLHSLQHHHYSASLHLYACNF